MKKIQIRKTLSRNQHKNKPIKRRDWSEEIEPVDPVIRFFLMMLGLAYLLAVRLVFF